MTKNHQYRNPDKRCHYPWTSSPTEFCWAYANHVDERGQPEDMEQICKECEHWKETPTMENKPELSARDVDRLWALAAVQTLSIDDVNRLVTRFLKLRENAESVLGTLDNLCWTHGMRCVTPDGPGMVWAVRNGNIAVKMDSQKGDELAVYSPDELKHINKKDSSP